MLILESKKISNFPFRIPLLPRRPWVRTVTGPQCKKQMLVRKGAQSPHLLWPDGYATSPWAGVGWVVRSLSAGIKVCHSVLPQTGASAEFSPMRIFNWGGHRKKSENTACCMTMWSFEMLAAWRYTNTWILHVKGSLWSVCSEWKGG